MVRTVSGASLSAIVAMLAASGSYGQAAPEAAPPPADKALTAAPEIIVTAQRRAESLSKVGITVSAVGAQELQRRGVTELGDLAKLVPGFQTTSSYGGAPILTLRGVGFNSRNASSTAPVGLYMDEAAVAYPYMSLGMIYDLERVEVLKGPQGTLYGRNATGGLINYVAAKPTKSFEGGLTLEAGSYQTLNASGFVSGPLNELVRVRLAFNSENRGEGWQHSITRDERLGKLYQKAARLTVDVGNGGPFSATVTGSYWKRTGDTLATQAIYYISDANPATHPFTSDLVRQSIQPHPTSVKDVDWYSASSQRQSAAGILHSGPLTNSEFYLLTGKLGYELSQNIRLQSLTSYQHLRQRDVSDASGTQAANFEVDARNRIHSLSQELRLLGDSGRLKWSVGGYYARDHIDTDEINYAGDNAVIARLRYVGAFVLPHPGYTNPDILNSFGYYDNGATTLTKVFAGFGNAEYKLNDLFKLTAGARYTKDTTDFSGCTYDIGGHSVAFANTVYRLFGVTSRLNPGECYTLNATDTDFVRTSVDNRIDQKNLSWRANLDVTPSPTTLVYGSISRGYKSGGFPVLSASAEAQFAPVKQERLTAYEAGVKLSLFERRMQLNLAGFYYDYTNKQVFGRVQDPIFTTLSRIRNIPKSREIGAEGDLTWRLSRSLTAHASGTYLASKVLRFSDYTDFGQLVDIRGKTFPYTPRFSGAGSLTYDAPVSQVVNLAAEVGVNYQSKSHADTADLEQFRIKGYALVDGSIGLHAHDDRWSLSLYGKNLFNTYYWTGVASNIDVIFRFPGTPRELGARAAFRF